MLLGAYVAQNMRFVSLCPKENCQLFRHRRSRTKKISVLCLGYNGVNNIGSEAKLCVVLDDIRHALGDRLGRVGILTQNVRNQSRFLSDFDRASSQLYRASFKALFRIIRHGYDVLLLTEGSTFIDAYSSAFLYVYCTSAWIAKLFDVPVIGYVNDCGHLKPSSQSRVRKTIHRCISMLILRNADAAERMRQYGVEGILHVTADSVYLYPSPAPERIRENIARLNLDPQKRPVIGIVPKEFFCWPPKIQFRSHRSDRLSWPFCKQWTAQRREMTQRYVKQLAGFCDWCVEHLDADVAIISMETMDAQVATSLYRTMASKAHARLLLSDELHIDDIVSVLSVLKLQVTSRYHSAVLASPYSVPFAVVSGDTRCESLLRELGMMEYFIDYVRVPETQTDVNIEEVLKPMALSLIARETELRSLLAKKHGQFKERAAMNRDLLKEYFSSRFPEESVQL